MRSFDELPAARVRLRRLRPADVPALHAYRNDPQVARYQTWGSLTVEQLAAFVAELEAAEPWTPGGIQIAIALRGSDELIGDCYFTLLVEDQRQAEIGYTLARQAQGHGYASEAIQVLLDYAFGALGLHRVIARAALPNASSIALMERIGMRREAWFRKSFWLEGEWLDEVLYAVLAEEWRELRNK